MSFGKVSFEGFVDYVNQRDPEQEIYHRSGWTDCAVGDYLDSNLISRDHAPDWAVNHLPRDVYDILNDPCNDDFGEANTYGGLAKVIRDAG